jgi:hypothetical protein
MKIRERIYYETMILLKAKVMSACRRVIVKFLPQRWRKPTHSIA